MQLYSPLPLKESFYSGKHIFFKIILYLLGRNCAVFLYLPGNTMVRRQVAHADDHGDTV